MVSTRSKADAAAFPAPAALGKAGPSVLSVVPAIEGAAFLTNENNIEPLT